MAFRMDLLCLPAGLWVVPFRLAHVSKHLFLISVPGYNSRFVQVETKVAPDALML